MKDHNIKVSMGQDEARSGVFNYLRIVEQTGRIALQFPTSNTEFAEFKRGDVLEFETDQGEFVVRSLEEDDSAPPVDFTIQTMAGIRARSALLVGDVTITGVEQDSSDSPLIVRVGRGLDYTQAADIEFVAAGPQPPGAIEWYQNIPLYHCSASNNVGETVAFIHITNNNGVPLSGSASNIANTLVGVSAYTGSEFVTIRWLAAGETVRIPANFGQSFAFGQIINAGDVSQGNIGRVSVVPEYE